MAQNANQTQLITMYNGQHSFFFCNWVLDIVHLGFFLLCFITYLKVILIDVEKVVRILDNDFTFNNVNYKIRLESSLIAIQIFQGW